MTIAEMLRRLESVNLEEDVPVIIEKQSADIILLNQLQLYQGGIDSKGNQLQAYHSKWYADYKYAKNSQPGLGVPDLKDTGAFYQDFNIEVIGSSISVNSSDSKTPELVDKYGKDIFGFTKESRSEYINEILKPAIQNYITKKTGLVFK